MMTDRSDADASTSGSGENSISTEVMSGTGHPVWLLLLVVVGLLVVSLVFLIIVLAYNKVKRKKTMKLVHEQQKRRNGSQASVYIVRSQEIELQSSRARSPEFVNVLENMNVNASSQEELIQTDSRSNNTLQSHITSEEHIIGSPEEHAPMEGEEGRRDRVEDRENGINMSTQVDSGLEFTRQSNARSSVRSESGLERIRSEQVNSGKQFSRQMSERMCSHSDDKILGRSRRETGNKFTSSQRSARATISGGNLKHADTNTIQETLEDVEHYGESMDGRQSIVIHQVQSPTLPEDNRIPVAGLRVDITTAFSDIPSFKDPELLSGDEPGSLGLPAPPDIYSSQILNTVESPEEAEDEPDDEECSGVITETNRHSRSLDRIISLQPQSYESDASDADEEFVDPDPRYSRIIIKSRPQSVEDTDNLYDEPIIVTTPTSERLLLTPIFDDPGYDQGFISLGSIATASNKDTHLHQHYPQESQVSTWNETARMKETGETGVVVEDSGIETHVVGEQSEDHIPGGPSESQFGGSQAMNQSTLALLEFEEEELQDMDPDLLLHLQEDNGSYAV